MIVLVKFNKANHLIRIFSQPEIVKLNGMLFLFELFKNFCCCVNLFVGLIDLQFKAFDFQVDNVDLFIPVSVDNVVIE